MITNFVIILYVKLIHCVTVKIAGPMTGYPPGFLLTPNLSFLGNQALESKLELLILLSLPI